MTSKRRLRSMAERLEYAIYSGKSLNGFEEGPAVAIGHESAGEFVESLRLAACTLESIGDSLLEARGLLWNFTEDGLRKWLAANPVPVAPQPQDGML